MIVTWCSAGGNPETRQIAGQMCMTGGPGQLLVQLNRSNLSACGGNSFLRWLPGWGWRGFRTQPWLPHHHQHAAGLGTRPNKHLYSVTHQMIKRML